MNKKNPYILSIITSIPFILWAILQILPTFDDWTTLSMPNYDPNYLTYILLYLIVARPYSRQFLIGLEKIKSLVGNN